MVICYTCLLLCILGGFESRFCVEFGDERVIRGIKRCSLLWGSMCSRWGTWGWRQILIIRLRVELNCFDSCTAIGKAYICGSSGWRCRLLLSFLDSLDRQHVFYNGAVGNVHFGEDQHALLVGHFGEQDCHLHVVITCIVTLGLR